MNPSQFEKSGWITCRCGKQTWRRVTESRQQLADLRFQLEQNVLCQSCSATLEKVLNLCPESVPVDGGIAACRLSYDHIGQCEPYTIPAEALEELKKRSESA